MLPSRGAQCGTPAGPLPRRPRWGIWGGFGAEFSERGGRLDHGGIGDVPREQRGPRASFGHPCSRHLASIARSDPTCCRREPGPAGSPPPPPVSPLRRGFVSPRPEGHGPPRSPPYLLLRGAREMCRLVGFSAGAAEGAAGGLCGPSPAPAPPLQLCPPRLPGSGDGAVPVPRRGSRRWRPALTRLSSAALCPRESCRPRRLRRRVLILYYFQVFDRMRSGASEADAVGRSQAREKIPPGKGGTRRFPAQGSSRWLSRWGSWCQGLPQLPASNRGTIWQSVPISRRGDGDPPATAGTGGTPNSPNRGTGGGRPAGKRGEPRARSGTFGDAKGFGSEHDVN